MLFASFCLLAVSEYLEPTIRQSNLLGDGVGGTVRYTEDGKLVILISGADSLKTADKINNLANECAYYIDLQMKGKPRSLTFEEARTSEGFSDLLETLVGTVIPPSHPGLRAKQQRVRDTVNSYTQMGIPGSIFEAIKFDAGMDHGLDPFDKNRPSVPIKTGLPEDCK